MREPVTLEELMWARMMNRRLLNLGVCAVYFKANTRIRFVGDLSRIPQDVYDEVKERKDVFATYLWKEVMKGTAL